MGSGTDAPEPAIGDRRTTRTAPDVKGMVVVTARVRIMRRPRPQRTRRGDEHDALDPVDVGRARRSATDLEELRAAADEVLATIDEALAG